jgi:hypothetical protein
VRGPGGGVPNAREKELWCAAARAPGRAAAGSRGGAPVKVHGAAGGVARASG